MDDDAGAGCGGRGEEGGVWCGFMVGNSDNPAYDPRVLVEEGDVVGSFKCVFVLSLFSPYSILKSR